MRSIVPFLPLIALSAVLSVADVATVTLDRSPSTAASRISDIGLSLFLILWITTDARRRRCVPCHEFGFLVGVYLPASLVWYAFWTRGWRGIWLLATLVAIAAVPSVAATVAYLIRHGPG